MGVSKREKKSFKLESVPVAGRSGTEISKCPPKTKASIQSHHSKMEITKLPKGLIGEKCIAQVTITGQECNCLIDTGSQVTTIPLSFYEQCLSEYPINSLSGLLEVEGANRLSVPYLGYIELNITFPAEFIGTSVEVSTLALVVPDPKSHTMHLVLIGTNTLDTLYEEHLKVGSVTFQPSLLGYRAVLNTLRLRYKYDTTGVLGHVRLRDKVPEVMAVGQTVVLQGIAHVLGFPTDKWVVVEHPSIYSLPGEIVVKNCLLTLPSRQSSHLPVVLTNETDHDITIPQRCVIAEIHALESVLSSDNAVSKSAFKKSRTHMPCQTFEETFSALNGSKWFTVLDLKSGYYQIEVAEEDKPKTAFVKSSQVTFIYIALLTIQIVSKHLTVSSWRIVSRCSRGARSEETKRMFNNSFFIEADTQNVELGEDKQYRTSDTGKTKAYKGRLN